VFSDRLGGKAYVLCVQGSLWSHAFILRTQDTPWGAIIWLRVW